MDGFSIFLDLIIPIGGGLIWGSIAASVRENKGYGRNWFWFGFFCGPIAMILAFAIPAREYPSYTETPDGLRQSMLENAPGEFERSVFSNESYVQRTVVTGGWQCACGRANAAYVSTCACGLSKRQNDLREAEYVAKVAQRREQEQAVISELKKYKMMLDSQVISQEEYDKRVRELSRL